MARMRTNKKTLRAEANRLRALSTPTTNAADAKSGNLSNITINALCLGAIYALCWVLGECESPSEQIIKANSDLTSGAKKQ